MSCSIDDIEVAKGYKAQAWNDLQLEGEKVSEADWATACSIIETRIYERFIKPINRLIEADTENRSGFVVLAIDFMLIETIQGFREGIVDHTGHSKRLFTNFVKDWSSLFDGFTAGCVMKNDGKLEFAKNLYAGGRCALLHSGSTDRIRVRVSGPMINVLSAGTYEINRNAFHKGVETEVAAYIEKLKSPQNNKLRQHAVIKMNAICGK